MKTGRRKTLPGIVHPPAIMCDEPEKNARPRLQTNSFLAAFNPPPSPRKNDCRKLKECTSAFRGFQHTVF